ncbi:MAG: fibronectin type III domain-containing protein, partial [Verrucomicrobiae bacterium]|nr:fibronectin type III domain-containing protein [Verrucomicrobiae bacterium]
NQSFLNSGVAARLRLVYCGEVSYSESGTMSTDLDRVTTPHDGYLDEVHSLRNSYGADLVVLLTEAGEPTYAGIAWLMCSPGSWFHPYAFSVVRRPYATSHTFIHELGHNLGCAHDRDHATCGAYNYSYGHRFYAGSGTQYRTIMAYPPGIRISHFSNPAITYLGAATGVAGNGPTSANNAQTINQTAAIVAAFRTTATPPPNPPTQLAAVGAAPDRIALSWQDTATNETGFVVLRAMSPTGPWQTIATLPADTVAHEDAGLTAATTYHYRLFAFNDTGSSPTTTVAAATTLPAPDTTPPDPPATVTAAALSSSSIRLVWSASNDTGGSGVAGYRVYRGDVFVATVRTTNHVVTGLHAGTSYCFRITARDYAGNESAPTGPACASTFGPPPAAPDHLVAVALAHNRVRLTWHDRADDETGFRIERAGSVAGPWTWLATLESNTTEYLDHGVTGNAVYYYRLRAENNGGASPWRTASVVTPAPPDETPPTTPGAVTGRVLSGIRVELRWNASTDSGGSGLAGYRIYHAGNLLGTVAAATWVTVSPLAPGQSHCFEVSAVDQAGNESARSAAVCVTTPAFPSPVGTWEVVGVGGWHGLGYVTFVTNQTWHGWGLSSDGCGVWELQGQWHYDDRGRIVAEHERGWPRSSCNQTNVSGVCVAVVNPNLGRMASLGVEEGRRFAWRGSGTGSPTDWSGRWVLQARIGASNHVETVLLKPTDRPSLWELRSEIPGELPAMSGWLLINSRGLVTAQIVRWDEGSMIRSVHVGRRLARESAFTLHGVDERGHRHRMTLRRAEP